VCRILDEECVSPLEKLPVCATAGVFHTDAGNALHLGGRIGVALFGNRGCVSWKQTAAGLEITGIPSAPASNTADAAVFKIALLALR
jgi:hypothetical protein